MNDISAFQPWTSECEYNQEQKHPASINCAGIQDILFKRERHNFFKIYMAILFCKCAICENQGRTKEKRKEFQVTREDEYWEKGSESNVNYYPYSKFILYLAW